MRPRLEDYATLVHNKAGKTVVFEVAGIEAARAAGLTVTVESLHRARERKLRHLKGGLLDS